MSVSDNNSKTPVSLPDPVPPDPGHSSSKHRNSNLIILVLFILLLAALGYVLTILPGLISRESPSSTTATQDRPAQDSVQPLAEKAPASPPPEANPLSGIKKSLYELKIQAETENVNSWAAEDYRVALENETRGNGYFNTRNFADANASYRLAVEKISEILETRKDRLTAALDKGHSALDKNNDYEAEKQFRLALALDPSEPHALTGLEKIETLRQATALLAEIADLEEAGKLIEAEKRLDHLLHLDPGNPEGIKTRERVKEQRAESDFNAKMSVIFSSLKTGDLKTAYQTLEKLKPQWSTHPQFAQAARILKDRAETLQIAGLLKEAEILAQKERWEDAHAIYEQILKIAPESLMALNGVKMAGERHRLDSALSESISKPDRLQDINHRETARKLVDYARRVEPSGQKLAAQTAELDRLVTIMSTPVTITINSDNLTEITIYKVGSLGHFFNRDLSLTPGHYTIIGTRRGYRDIRKALELTPETGALRIRVQCNEPI